MSVDWDKHVLAPCLDVFGEPITYMPAMGSPFSIIGVFNNAYSSITLIDDGSEINTTKPVLGVRDSEFPKPPVQGDKLYVPSVKATYIVRDVNPDSHGHTNLMLNRVSR